MKCIGCNNKSKTKKGWCSIDCYRRNQNLINNKGRFKKGHKLSEDWYKINVDKNKKWHKENKKRSLEIIKLMNTKESNLKKGHQKENHPLWIKDRSKLKQKRLNTEEKDFFKDILNERNYTCELTNIKGGKLSIHHIDSVHLYPNKKYNKDNVIVIKKEIHMDFHKKYGFQWSTKSKWETYLKNDFNKNEFK